MTFLGAESRSYLRKVGAVASGTLGAQLVVLAASPMLTRLYTPEQFGVFGVFGAIVSIVGGVLFLRQETAVLTAESDAEAAEALLAASAVGVLSVGLGVMTLLLVPGERRESMLGDSVVVLALLAPGAFLLALGRGAQLYLMRIQLHARVGQTRMWQSLAGVVCQLSFSGLGSVGLVAGTVVGNAVAALYALRPGLNLRRKMALGGVARSFVRHRKYATLSTPGSMLGSLLLFGPAILVGAVYGPAAAGAFALAHRVLATPLAALSQALSESLASEVAERLRTSDGSSLIAQFDRVIALSACGGLMIVAGSAVAPPVFAAVFGTEWRVAGEYVQALGPMYAAAFVAAPLGGVPDAVGRQQSLLARELVRAGLVAVALALGVLLALSVLQTLVLFSAAGAIGFLWAMIVARRALQWRLSSTLPIARSPSHKGLVNGEPQGE